MSYILVFELFQYWLELVNKERSRIVCSALNTIQFDSEKLNLAIGYELIW